MKSNISEKNPKIIINNIENTKAFELLTTNRKAQKYSLMCFFYNEQHRSRTDCWKNMYEEEYDTAVSDIDYQVMSDFSKCYSDFINECFPKLIDQLNLLNEIMSISVTDGLPIKITTLDKCIITWDFFHIREIKRNYYNPVSGTHDQYKEFVFTKQPTGKMKSKRLSRHKLSFRPNFIHSIDAALMRIFIQKFYTKQKKKLNHLHDCVMLHPNDVDAFYDVVKEVYCESDMINLAKNLFFSNMQTELTGVSFEYFKKLEKKFYDNMDKDLILDKNTFNPRKCYRFKGTR